MSSAYSPDAMMACWDTIHAAIPSAQLSGIYANKAGYHNCRNQLPSSDYSVQQPYDQKGDGWAAAALDVTLSDADMRKLTQRLIDETKANGDTGRLRGAREFFGTVGNGVTGMDVPGRYWVTSDPSHEWHIHISGKRQYANDRAAWQDIAAVLLGGDTTGDDDVNDEDIQKIATAVWQCAIRNDVTGKNAAAWAFLNSINVGVSKMPGAVWNTQIRNDVTGTPSPAWAFLTSMNTQVNQIATSDDAR